MTTRKRTDFWDVPSSGGEDSDAGYDSEAAQESKGRRSTSKVSAGLSQLRRPVKRRKVSIGESDSSDEEGLNVNSEPLSSSEQVNESDQNEDDDEQLKRTAETSQLTAHPTVTSASNTVSAPVQSPSETEEYSLQAPNSKPKLKSKKKKTGVVYLSSLPPYLKPSALKSLLAARGFGPITRCFLAPSTISSSASQKRSNKRRTYTEGWIEFESKRTAKICAETLNATIVGGKKGGWYHDDVWNMKYLRGMKWADLVEQVQREKREAEAKRVIEDSRARKEDKIFLQGVEKAKVIEGIKKKRQEKKKLHDDDIGDSDRTQQDRPRMVFKQNEIRHREDDKSQREGKVAADVQKVLAKIF